LLGTNSGASQTPSGTLDLLKNLFQKSLKEEELQLDDQLPEEEAHPTKQNFEPFNPFPEDPEDDNLKLF
jgi:hypothetical protein